jgi:prevent-host-death family protein
MVEMIGVADAKKRFAELVGRVQAGERFVVTRRGRPVVALVPVEHTESVEPGRMGLISLVGAMEDWPEFGEVMDEVYASRRGQFGRDVPDFDELD